MFRRGELFCQAFRKLCFKIECVSFVFMMFRGGELFSQAFRN